MIKHKLKDLVKSDTNIRGIYRGVVESIDDPVKRGRVQCRIHGLHSFSTDINEIDGVDSDHLPWCEPAIPFTEFGTDGSGMFGVPQVGAHVLIFFENENLMKPIYFAAVPSKDDWNTTAEPGVFVFKLPGGQYVECDSNSGSETIKVSHPTGTEVEVDSEGNIDITGSGNI